MKAQYYIILTDQDGVFTDNPETSNKAKLIETLTEVSDEMINNAPTILDGKEKVV